MIKNKLTYIVLTAIGLVACEPEFENEVSNSSYSAGNADFTTFVALGNSLTAGTMDGTMYRTSVENSYPNIMAGQFSKVGGGDFTQPSFEDDLNNVGGFLIEGNAFGDKKFVFDGAGLSVPDAEVTIDGLWQQKTAYNNAGVPGAKSYHLAAPGYGNPAGLPTSANVYFARTATESNATVIGDAMSLEPTFFALWIGNNDVLSYATGGGVGEDHNETGNVDPSTYNSNDITNNLAFESVYTSLVQTLVSGGAKGTLATIPDVTSIPYFTAVPYNSIPMDAATAAGTNMAYAGYNGALQQAVAAQVMTAQEAAARTINFKEGMNPVVIIDETLTDITFLNPALVKMRMATANDLITLPAASFIGTLADPTDSSSVNGVAIPLADNWVLTPDEQERIATATNAYNGVIRNLASQYDLALADMQAGLADLADGGYVGKDGAIYDGGFVSASNANNLVFSLDGVHPNARGYAIISNIFIEAINKEYASSVPFVVEGDYPGLQWK